MRTLPLWLLGLATVATAQDDVDLTARAGKLAAEAERALTTFARSAVAAKLPSLARSALQLLGDGYGVAVALPTGDDAASPSQRNSLERAWATLGKRFAPSHFALGEQCLAAGDAVAAAQQFALCLRYDPEHRAAHAALGHREVNGYFGSDEQIAFLERWLAIDARARELAADDRGAVLLPAADCPAELRQAGLAVVGAKAGPWKVWTTSPGSDVALDAARWLSRAHELLEFLLPAGPARREARLEARPVHWLLLLRTEAEWQRFFTANPELLARHKLDQPPGGSSFRAQTSTGTAQLYLGPAEHENDRLVAEVTMWGFAGRYNEGLGQGLVHTMTSLLCGTTLTWYGALPKTVASPRQAVPRDPRAWAARLREELLAGQDWPLVQLPRERLTSFREQVRIKSWSFVGWLVARHPVEWPRWFVALDPSRKLLPEDVERACQDAFGRSVDELEREWREFARGDSALAKAAARGR